MEGKYINSRRIGEVDVKLISGVQLSGGSGGGGSSGTVRSLSSHVIVVSEVDSSSIGKSAREKSYSVGGVRKHGSVDTASS